MPLPAISVTLVGFDALERRLEAMPLKIQDKLYRKALRSAAGKVAKRLKAGTPKDTGMARRNVKTKISVKTKKGVAWARIQYKGKPSFYLRVYEHGALKSGRQPARPFFDRAIGNFEAEVSRDFANGLRQAVESA